MSGLKTEGRSDFPSHVALGRARLVSLMPRRYRCPPLSPRPVRPRSPAISPDFAIVCLFSLLGLMLTAAVLSYVSNETISMLFISIG